MLSQNNPHMASRPFCSSHAGLHEHGRAGDTACTSKPSFQKGHPIPWMSYAEVKAGGEKRGNLEFGLNAFIFFITRHGGALPSL